MTTSKLNKIIGEISSEERSALVSRLKEKAAVKSEGRVIPRREESENLPLSFAQQRLWFFYRLEPDSNFYNMSASFSLTGRLNVEGLEYGLNEIVRRHETLRTTFKLVGGKPRQVIAPELTLPLPLFDLSGLPPDERRAEADRLRQEAQEAFNLEVGPPVRVSLLRMSAEEHILFLTIHHIVTDGWSLGIIIGEIAAFYEAFLTGAKPSLAELPIQYADFALWQREWLSGEVLERQLDYWKRQLGGNLPVLELPLDKPRPGVQTYRGDHLVFEIGKTLAGELRELSRRHEVTLYMTLLAAFKTLLRRYTGQEDIVVGTPIANRNLVDIENLVGFFVNTLVLRTRLRPDSGFDELLQRVREVTLGAYAHQDVPFEKLVEELQPERNLSHSPLFQVMFALQNAPMPPLQLPGLKLKLLDDEAATSQFDLTLDITEEADGLRCTIEFNTDLFEHSTARRIFAHYEHLLKGIVRDSRQSLSRLPLLPHAERMQLLLEWNATAKAYPHHKCLHQLIEEQAARTPEAVSVIYDDVRLTYRELNVRADQLAGYLQELGVGPETRVGILLDRSIETAVTLLGVLKAGGGYVALDSSYPPQRLAYMLEDAEVKILLTQERYARSLPEHATRIICVDGEAASIARRDTRNPESGAVPGNLAYLIYTSGTTGTPKGILVPHHALVNAAYAFISHHHVTPDDRILQFASLSFDVAAEEFFSCWLSGACAVMRPGQVICTHAEFVSLLEKRGVTLVNLPASFWADWLNAMEENGLRLPVTLRRVVVGNEKTLLGTLIKWRSVVGEDVEWNNAYGPTEATVTSSNYEPAGDAIVRHIGSVPIGRPVMNAQMYILDDALEAVPVGVAGELYIGGAGLARGYHKQPAQTAERFIPHPHSLKGGARLYRTGDFARYLPGGDIEFLGRMDEQVKIRGFRIELTEIESVLIRHPNVREAVVIVREDAPDDKRLIAYVVAANDAEATHTELSRYLSERLPDYMLPRMFVTLRELPLTPNGKVDRKVLPDAGSIDGGSQDAYVAPRSEIEAGIASVWQEMLKVERIGINDNFFGLGGHSLLMVQVNARLCELLACELSIIEMFKYPTVGTLAAYLSRPQAVSPTSATHTNSSDKRTDAATRRRLLKHRQGIKRPQAGAQD